MAKQQISGHDRPKYAPIDWWCRYSGTGRSTTYKLLRAGKLRAIKVGKRTLIDVDHGTTALASMPSAYSEAA